MSERESCWDCDSTNLKDRFVRFENEKNVYLLSCRDCGAWEEYTVEPEDDEPV